MSHWIADMAIVAIAAIAAALGALQLLARRRPLQDAADAEIPVRLLFEGDTIIDATPAAEHLLRDTGDRPTDWERFYAAFAPRFAGIPAAPDTLADAGPVRLQSSLGDDDGLLDLSRHATALRVDLVETAPDMAVRHRYLVALRETELMAATLDSTPNPMWHTDDSGQVVWSNSAYRDLEAPQGAPPFSGALLPECGSTRLRLGNEPEAPKWFDVNSARWGCRTMHVATDATHIVEAEAARRNFVQTLTKTFAHLSIGLAIFDRDRRLALFNPALVDLTGLPAELLSARPNLLSFFDHLRDHRIMPEPKDYSCWRERMAHLVADASDGRFSETWSLPDGRTYRIGGKPHPDGAIAFLLEDISDEISLTRQFRAQLDLNQAALDRVDSAMAVFAPDRRLVFSNAAYRSLWGNDPDEHLNEQSLDEAIAFWRHECRSGTDWERIGSSSPAGGRAVQATLRDGRRLTCRCDALPGGSLMVGFTAAAPDAAAQEAAG